ncbi:hypothetical protein VPNG_00060 [Cytospora leucostoma]|uniref:Uncharacterized protein n=1 Tax=Cytospora leucostoma TaxID=1230097 RepID=A0A423XNB2_9PEZI|nr:hypothetical protein VPNG_00060 [Cytospora leucostoma]
MESIQLAQMLADISDLSAADARAAAALVNANKTLPTITPSTQAQSQNDEGLKPLRPTSSAHANRLDQLGRRVLTPPLTRSNSNQGSIPGTPREHHPGPGDDVDRASTLMALYEIRNKLKQQDNTSLVRAREKIDAMIAKHKNTEQSQQQHGKQGDASQGPERPRLTSRYTFPKADPTNTPVVEK